jgi:hypothetical protein
MMDRRHCNAVWSYPEDAVLRETQQRVLADGLVRKGRGRIQTGQYAGRNEQVRSGGRGEVISLDKIGIEQVQHRIRERRLSSLDWPWGGCVRHECRRCRQYDESRSGFP